MEAFHFENQFSSQLLHETVNHINIEVGKFSYYSGYHHKHDFIQCARYLHPKRKDVDKLKIGSFCSIGSGAVFMMAGNQGHDINWASTFPFYFQANIFKEAKNAYKKAGDTIIGNDVWIGSEAMIMPGIKIGNGAVIAARSVITKDVEDYAVMGGNPAILIKFRFKEEKIKQLLKIKWWNWEEKKIKENMNLICSTKIEDLWEYWNINKKDL